MKYKASFDTLTKTFSVLIIIIFLVLGYKNFNLIFADNTDTAVRLINSITLIFFLALIIGSYLFSTENYLLEADAFIIKRPIGEVKIPFTEVEEIRNVSSDEMKRSIRTFGNGGLFGYYGKYYNKTLGSMTLYTTQRKNRMLIRTKSGNKIIITPDDPGLAEAAKQEMTKIK